MYRSTMLKCVSAGLTGQLVTDRDSTAAVKISDGTGAGSVRPDQLCSAAAASR